MGVQKHYTQDTAFYEKKLKTVMVRMGATDVDYDWTRREGWVQFKYKGRAHRFDQSVEKAAANGHKMYFGTDCFAQVVLWLEALARAGDFGIYSLETILDGLPALPAPVPEYFKLLGFSHIPADAYEVIARFKEIVKTEHPDVGGTHEAFIRLQEAKKQALEYFEKEKS
jgi:hypothetical protein